MNTTTNIDIALRYDTTDPGFPGWYAEYRRDGEVISDSMKVGHPEMPSDEDAEAEARAIAEKYAASVRDDGEATGAYWAWLCEQVEE